MGPLSNITVVPKRGGKEIHRETHNESREWSDVSISQGLQAAQEAKGKAWNKFFPRAFRQTADLLIP